MKLKIFYCLMYFLKYKYNKNLVDLIRYFRSEYILKYFLKIIERMKNQGKLPNQGNSKIW